MGLRSRGGMIATALAITAVAAPSAQAFVELPGAGAHLATAVQQIQVNAKSLEVYSHRASTSSRVRPNPDEQFLGSKPAVASPSKATTGRGQTGDPWLSAALAQGAQAKQSKIGSTANAAASTASDSRGFQYDDAAIGAGLMAGLVLLGTAGTVAVRRRGQLRHS